MAVTTALPGSKPDTACRQAFPVHARLACPAPVTWHCSMTRPGTWQRWARSATHCLLEHRVPPPRGICRPAGGAIVHSERSQEDRGINVMNGWRRGLCVLSMVLAPAAGLAAAPPIPGLSQPLSAGPFTFRTGEGQDIRVTVLARLPWPYS